MKATRENIDFKKLSDLYEVSKSKYCKLLFGLDAEEATIKFNENELIELYKEHVSEHHAYSCEETDLYNFSTEYYDEDGDFVDEKLFSQYSLLNIKEAEREVGTGSLIETKENIILINDFIEKIDLINDNFHIYSFYVDFSEWHTQLEEMDISKGVIVRHYAVLNN